MYTRARIVWLKSINRNYVETYKYFWAFFFLNTPAKRTRKANGKID